MLLQRAAQALGEAGKTAAVADVQLQHGCLDSGLFQSGNYGLGFVRLAVVGANHIDTACGQVFGSITAKAAAGASDQGNFAGHGEYLRVGG
ncbi:hypothetical protein D3C76_1342410 [compost metagenome]